MTTNVTGKSDDDCLFLEQVLDKLYDFGTKKKKKRKRLAETEDAPESKDSLSADVAQKDQQVEVVMFQDPRKKIKTKHPSTPDTIKLPQTKDKNNEGRHNLSKDKNSEPSEELSLEKARLEVHRFGITGYKKEQQRVFEQDRAIMLGARPPKQQYVNYKVLQQQIKEKKQKEKEEVDPELKTKKKRKNNPKDKKKQSTSEPGTGPSGQVGRFKNGMLILSSKEIQKIKGSKRGR